MKKVAVLTGAGISAESGLSTFRDSGGLWEKYRIEEVATYQAWATHPELVLEFYNDRRRQLKEVRPNAAHEALAKLEKCYDVQIITQNVDDLHERAGSTKILHLHGELKKVRSTKAPWLVYDWEDDLYIGDMCEMGYQLRPHIVWFGEAVPAIGQAEALVQAADIIMVVGTSLQVYPAAGLVHSASLEAPVYYIDPNPAEGYALSSRYKVIAEKASVGVPQLVDELLQSGCQ